MAAQMPRDRFPAWSVFGAALSGAGLPIYIYAPKYYADTFGVSLAALGGLLFALRLFDVVQDPVLGWIAERLGRVQPYAVAFAAAVMALSMLGLFAVTPPIAAFWWFALTITGLFTSFSFLTITFYAQGIAKVGDAPGGHVRLAAWRESGALLGVCIAAVAPTALMAVTEAPFAAFAAGFAAVTLLAVVLMWPEWTGGGANDPVPMRAILADGPARRLLILALVNATPLAVTSTLFLFYVESRLAAPGWEGALLVLFFLAAAISSPGWSMLAGRYGTKPVLLTAMVLAILSFGVAYTLGPGDVAWFAVICVLSGATIGADLTLMPALFARRMARISPNGGQGFGLWGLMNKFTLAFAAVALLPLLEGAGFVAGATDLPEQALSLLSVLYAAVPLALKLVAIVMLSLTRLEDQG
jgi:glycoside/pentoside/hexuronide:cation symporter, GPH family